MPQQGMPQPGFMPQPGLDPRMGYAAQGGRIGFNSGGETAYENWLIDNYDLLVSDLSWDDHSKYSKLFRDQKAQGGRIGYNLGGIDRPFQGVGALNRMGYQVGSSDIPGIPGVGKAMRDVEFPTFSEGVNQEFPSNELGAIDTTVQEDISTTGGNQIQETVMALVNSGIDTREAITQAHTLNQIESDYPGVTEIAIAFIKKGHALKDAVIQAVTIMKTSQVEQRAHGGRIGAQGGGIMPLLDMGGMEKDYRQEGGFVPIGRKEKADDVPARLSKNEFVFTADAVKAAGGGDIDEGAQRMYNVMKNLEAGGEISEQSQGQG